MRIMCGAETGTTQTRKQSLPTSILCKNRKGPSWVAMIQREKRNQQHPLSVQRKEHNQLISSSVTVIYCSPLWSVMLRIITPSCHMRPRHTPRAVTPSILPSKDTRTHHDNGQLLYHRQVPPTVYCLAGR